MRLSDLPPEMRKQAEEQLAPKGRDPGEDAQSECDPHQALAKYPQVTEPGQGVYLVVLLYRCGGIRWDLDNASFKPFLDGLVEKGLLEDDSCKEIRGLVKLPKKVKTMAEERTELEFWDAEYFGGFIEAARNGN